MPRIISSVAKLWQTVVGKFLGEIPVIYRLTGIGAGMDVDYNSTYGSAKVVKQQLLEFLSPIAVHHGASFLAAVAVAWYERRNHFINIKAVSDCRFCHYQSLDRIFF